MRLGVRSVPWLLALAGLAIPLVGSGFALGLLVALWLDIVALVWVVGRAAPPPGRSLRVALAVGALPILFLFAWEGGWWLIPADLAWVLIELADPRRSQPRLADTR
jgi:hypothetical protein